MPSDLPRGIVPDDDGADEQFDREVALLRSLAEHPVELVDAPADLFDRIAAAVHAEAGGARAGEAVPIEGGRTRRSRGSRGVRWAVSLAVAALVVLLVGAAVIAVNRSSSGPREVASARLAPYGGAEVGDADGTVQVVRDGDRLTLEVDMHDLPTPPPGTFYELWLIDPSTGEPVSVATMRDGSHDVTTDIELPSDIDTKRFDVVDISLQQESAGPQHSGQSVLRGTLSA